MMSQPIINPLLSYFYPSAPAFSADPIAVHQSSALLVCSASSINPSLPPRPPAMRLKIRSPAGTNVLALGDDATLSELLAAIREATSISGDLDIRCGFPPKTLQLGGYPSSTPLSSLPMKLEGEQLIISGSESAGGGLRGTGGGVVKDPAPDRGAAPPEAKTALYAPASSSSKPSGSSGGGGGGGSSYSFSTGSRSSERQSSPPSNLPSLAQGRMARAVNKDDPPDVALADGQGTVVLRVMEDDNSCLFRALSYVLTHSMMSVVELRQLVAETIRKNPTTYSEAVLEQSHDAYCEWIKMDSSWGGGIELGILADFFDVEVPCVSSSLLGLLFYLFSH